MTTSNANILARTTYAGHTDKTGPATTTYIKADLQAIATAWPL
jgi:hypothetical protein